MNKLKFSCHSGEQKHFYHTINVKSISYKSLFQRKDNKLNTGGNLSFISQKFYLILYIVLNHGMSRFT